MKTEELTVYMQTAYNFASLSKAVRHKVGGVLVTKQGIVIPGVCWHSQTGKYRAYITQHGKQTSLGLHDTLESAIAARKNAEILVYGYNRP